MFRFFYSAVGLFFLLPSLAMAVDGSWSQWGCFGPCSETCGQGTQRRTRTCTSPAPANGGSDCCGPSEEDVCCNLGPCPEAVPNTAPALPEECENKPTRADIQFLLDASSSVKRKNFVQVKEFVKHVVQNFSIGLHGVVVGVTTFNKKVYNQFLMNEHTTHSSLLAAIDAIPTSLAGGTHTGKGLQFVRTIAFAEGNGNRDNVSNFLILVADGKSFPQSQKAITLTEADELHKTDITVLAVGVGNKVDEEELKAIASTPENVFHVKDFDGLDSVLQSLQKNVC